MQVAKAEKYVLDLLEENLPGYLHYHDLAHTHCVLNRSLELAREEGVTDQKELDLLRTAALYHDSGFIHVYDNHEEEGCRIAREVLPGFEYSQQEIDIICGMIMATKLPQSPVTHLEKILCDADLDHLGKNNFQEVGKKLHDEWLEIGKMHSEKEWNEIQVNFLENHQFWTESSRKRREQIKEENLRGLKEKLYC